MRKLDSFLSIISEDSVDAPSSSIAPGGFTSGQPPTNQEFTTLSDLIKYKNGNVADIGSTHNKILGAPLQHILDELVISYVHIENISSRFKEAQENPVYAEKPNTKPVFVRVDRHIEAIKSQIKQIAQDLDKLSLD
jgi:hypothetical protein